MKINLKTITSILLVLIMLVSILLLSSCGNESTQSDKDSGRNSDNTNTEIDDETSLRPEDSVVDTDVDDSNLETDDFVVDTDVEETDPESFKYMLKPDGTYQIIGLERKSLVDIVIPAFYQGVPVTSIAWSAFADTYINSVILSDNIVSISDRAFANCMVLTSIVIPDSVTSIGGGAFYGCQFLSNVKIGKNVKSIGSGAFNDCYALTNVYITDMSAWCNILFKDEYSNPLNFADNLILNKKIVTNLTIPGDVTSISDFAFIKCKSIEKVTIPKSVKSIGYRAFASCENLTDVRLENKNWSIISTSNGEKTKLEIDFNDYAEVAKCLRGTYSYREWLYE